MHCIALIPARGGSKGIPQKNLKRINGRTLLQRSIEAAAASSYVNEVYVSSDDDDILAEALRCGAKIIKRPDDLSNDTATSESALLHAIYHLEGKSCNPEILLFLQCTSPFIQSGDIDNLLGKMYEEQADCALSVTHFHGFLWEPGDNGLVPIGHEKHVRPRRQDRNPVYLETGAAYAMRVDGFKQAKHRFFGKISYHVMEQMRAGEIDEPIDLIIAEEVANEIEGVNVEFNFPSTIGALLLDFDGVMTDDCAIVDQNGVESVRVSRSDGMGIERLKNFTDLFVGVVSKETNPVVKARCEKLQIPCLQGVNDKAQKLKDWAEQTGISLSSVVYVGNDLNDLPVFPLVGTTVAPCDAHDSVYRTADIKLRAKGGNGAVREICEILISELDQRGKARSDHLSDA